MKIEGVISNSVLYTQQSLLLSDKVTIFIMKETEMGLVRGTQ